MASYAAATTHKQPGHTLTRSQKVLFSAVAVVAGLAIGGAAAIGLSPTFLVAGAIAPFILILALARPHLAVTLYVVLVYADLLSILVRFHGFPPLARFAGAMLLSAVLGHRLLVHRQKPATDEMTRWLIAYAIMLALGLVYARDPDLVMSNVVEFVRNFITYLIIINSLSTRARLRNTLWALLAMGTLLSSLTVYQSLTGQFNNDFGGLAQYPISGITGILEAPRPSGTLADPNYYGQTLIFILPLGLYLLLESKGRIARLIGLLTSITMILAIIFTYSRGDAIALVIMLVAAVIYKRPRPIALAGGALVLLAILPLLPANYVERFSSVVGAAQGDKHTIVSEESIRGRAGAAQSAVKMFADYPILGVGRENYPLYELDYVSGTSLALKSKGIPPHDLYLEIAAEHGIVGMIVVSGLLLAIWRAVLDARRRFFAMGDRPQAALAAWLGIGMIGYLASALFLHGAFLYMLWLQIALIVAIRRLSHAPPPAAAES